MKKKRYRVTVKAIDGTSEETIGSIVVEAKDRDAASQLGIGKLWKPELDARGARADTHVERITGEGG